MAFQAFERLLLRTVAGATEVDSIRIWHLGPRGVGSAPASVRAGGYSNKVSRRSQGLTQPVRWDSTSHCLLKPFELSGFGVARRIGGEANLEQVKGKEL